MFPEASLSAEVGAPLGFGQVFQQPGCDFIGICALKAPDLIPLTLTAAAQGESSHQLTESIVVVFGLAWSLNTVVQCVSAVLGVATLMFIAYQTYLSRKSSEVAATHMRYSMILETNKFIFENPEFAPRAVGPKRFEAVKKMSEAERKGFFAWELLLDNFEFYYLVGLHESKSHARRFLETLLGNPEIRGFLKGPLCGTFRREFEDVFRSVIKKIDSRNAETAGSATPVTPGSPQPESDPHSACEPAALVSCLDLSRLRPERRSRKTPNLDSSR